VARLKAYKERLIVFPRRSNKPKQGDTKTNPREVEKVTLISEALPIAPTDIAFKEISKSDMPEPIEGGAYMKLRNTRAWKRHAGAREKREKDRAEAETAKK
jgi:large subunit ribosomal protein L13e